MSILISKTNMKITQSTKPVRVWTSRQYGLLVVSFSAFIEEKEGIFTCEFLQLEPGEWGTIKFLKNSFVRSIRNQR